MAAAFNCRSIDLPVMSEYRNLSCKSCKTAKKEISLGKFNGDVTSYSPQLDFKEIASQKGLTGTQEIACVT